MRISDWSSDVCSSDLPALDLAIDKPGFMDAWAAVLAPVLRQTAERPVLVLRDYHADNLMWLPERNGIRALGLLDFQGGLAGHPAYDLVSLLQDARRDVAEALEAAMIERYVEAAERKSVV